MFKEMPIASSIPAKANGFRILLALFSFTHLQHCLLQSMQNLQNGSILAKKHLASILMRGASLFAVCTIRTAMLFRKGATALFRLMHFFEQSYRKLPSH